MKYDIKMFQKLVQILQYKGRPIGTPRFKVTRVNCIHNIILVTLLLGSEGAVWRGSEKYVLLIWRDKPWQIPAGKFISWLGWSLQACNVDKNELVHEYFSMILIGNLSWLLSNFQNRYLQNIVWLLLCAISNITIENFAILQRGSTCFFYVKHSNSFKFCRP